MKLEDQILDMIRKLEEEIRINDQRIKQLSGAAGGAGGDMYKIVYDANENSVVDKAEKTTNSKFNIEQINGDLWILANANYDSSTQKFNRIDTSKYAFALQLQGTNNIPGETMQGVNLWRCSPGTNPIGDYGAVGGWETIEIWTAYKDTVLGGFGLEIDGDGTLPYGRFVHLTYDSKEWTGILTNLFADMSGRDDTAQPSWFIGRRDDEFLIMRMPSGVSQSLALLLKLDASGNLEIAGNVIVSGTVDGVDVSAHAIRHQNGGSDEINVAGLSGELADPQPPKAHKASHEEGGADALTPTNIGANWNKLVNKPSTFPPSAHAISHQNGGTDEINVTGLSGELADPQPPKAHTHDTADITTGLLDGDRLPGMSQTKKGGVPATGTPAGKFLKDDGTWGIPSVAGTASIGLKASDNIKNSNDTEKTTAAQTPEKRKEIKINKDYEGGLRVKWQMKVNYPGGTVYGQVYKNGVAQGVEQYTTNTNYVSFSEDLAGGLAVNDLIQIYIRVNEGYIGYVANMKLCFDWAVLRFDTWNLATPLNCTNTDALDATNQDPV